MTALWPFVLLTLIVFTALGLIMAPAFLAAMEPFGEIAGAAAAIGVATELALSTSATFLLGISADGSARPMTILMALAACGTLLGWIFLPVSSPAGTRDGSTR